MQSPLVTTERPEAGVLVLRIDRPPLNALSRAVMEELGAAVAAATTDPEARALVIAGGDKALAAGADVTELGSDETARGLTTAFRHGLDALVGLPRPVIAAIRGFALGGGLELALACDLRVAGESARLGVPEILLGLLPGAGGTQRLARLVGPARAKELVWSGRQVRAEEAAALGLVDRVVPDAEVEARAIAWAAELARGPGVAIGLAKAAIDRGLDGPLAAGLDLEVEAFHAALATEDAEIGIQSFLEHGPGKAPFTGR
jgi:enoyl-CoA hydratase/carnithine racemase